MAALFLRMPMAHVIGGVFIVLAAVGPVGADPFGISRTGGDEIAAIRSLSPEQARQIVTQRTDATARINTGYAFPMFARNGIALRGALMLANLESLDAETAAALAGYDEGPLFLDGLSTLSPEAARALKNFKGGPRSFASFGRCLSLAGLETLSAEAAESLAAFPGEALYLGVRELPEAAFRRLMRFQRRLYLPRLARIPGGAAESIADYRGTSLSLSGLCALSPEEARALTELRSRWNGRLPNLMNPTSQVAALLARFEGPRLDLEGASMSQDALEKMANYRGLLVLRGLTTLSDEQLAELAAFNGNGLRFGGLTSVTLGQARQLTAFETKFLSLDDVKDLSLEVAESLARFPGVMSLAGVAEPSPELMRALGRQKRSLTGVTSLSPEAAATLLEGFSGGDLTLNLTTLPEDTARELARGEFNSLFLRALPELSTEAAAALGSCRCTSLWLSGLNDLTPGAARGLAALTGRGIGPTLRLEGLTQLSPEAARALASSTITYLELSGLKTLSAATAEALAGSKAFSGSLPSLTTLSADAATALGRFGGNKAGGDKLDLSGLTALDAEAARGLAAFRGDLELDGLTVIDAETAAALLEHAGPKLSLRGLKTLSADAAKQLAKATAWDGKLPSLTSLADDAAQALAGFDGESLDLGPVPLSDRAVEALAGFQGSSLGLFVPRLSEASIRGAASFSGERLSLTGLAEAPPGLADLLPEFQCKTLSLHPWEWNLGRTRPVTTADARLLAAYAARLAKPCVAPGITCLETSEAVEIATILAASSGSLWLPNLERISSRTLTALIRNRNVELPPIESIQLIPEPDGGFTDDFMVPEDFPARKRQ